MNTATIRLELEVVPEGPGADGVVEPTRYLRYRRVVGLHSGIRAIGPLTLAAKDSPVQDPQVHWRKADLDGLDVGSMCLLVLMFDRFRWEGYDTGLVWDDSNRRFCVWLTRPQIELQADGDVVPGNGAPNRTILYLDELVDEVALDAGELGAVAFPDMMQIFYLGDIAILGFRPGLERIQLMVAQVSSEQTANGVPIQTDHYAYVLELKQSPADMVTMWPS